MTSAKNVQLLRDHFAEEERLDAEGVKAQFTEGDKIAEVREFLDTAYAFSLFDAVSKDA